MTTFDHAAGLGYDRRATRLLGSLYRRIAADIDTATDPGAAVADIGTGPGRLLSCLAERRPDLRLHGVDLSPHMIEIAHRNLTGHPVELAVADVRDLPYPDAGLDLAVSSLSMHEWRDLDAAAREPRPGTRRHTRRLRLPLRPHRREPTRAGRALRRRAHHRRPPAVASVRDRHPLPRHRLGFDE